jgi:hypothetical protein
MAQAHGRNAIVKIEDDGGTVRDLSADMNSVTLTWTKDNPDTMTFGKDNMQRISGTRDATLTGAGIWDGTETTKIDAVLAGLLAGSKVTATCFQPGGSVGGCPNYIACMLLNSYEITAPVGGVVAVTYAFHLASGSVTTGSN